MSSFLIRLVQTELRLERVEKPFASRTEAAWSELQARRSITGFSRRAVLNSLEPTPTASQFKTSLITYYRCPDDPDHQSSLAGSDHGIFRFDFQHSACGGSR